MEGLQEALAIENSDNQVHKHYYLQPAFIVEVCKSLIVHDKHGGIVRLTHSTVQEFLRA